jgi:hypothetical protein
MDPKMSLTEFIDVVLKTGTTKITKIRQIKNKPEYEPATDFYRSLRMYVIDFHQKMLYDQKKKTAVDLTQDPKKYEHFSILLNGYWKFLGKKKPKWFTPITKKVIIQTIEIAINPELGLMFNDDKYLIKMYMKTEDISKQKVDIALGMMEKYLRPSLSSDTKIAILDVRKSKLFEYRKEMPELNAAIQAECAYISSIWEQL